jgi:hypothetical protein
MAITRTEMPDGTPDDNKYQRNTRTTTGQTLTVETHNDYGPTYTAIVGGSWLYVYPPGKYVPLLSWTRGSNVDQTDRPWVRPNMFKLIGKIKVT